MNYGSKWSEKLNHILAGKHAKASHLLNKIGAKTILSIQFSLPFETNIPRMTNTIMGNE